MRSRLPAEVGRRLLGLLPATATAVAEGAWVAIVYAALQLGLANRPQALGLWAFIVAAGAGMVVGRRVRGRLARPAVVASVALAAVAGWATDPTVRDFVAGGAYDRALAGDVGWLLGVAAWRGVRHADPASDDLVVASLLVWGVPGLAVPWLVGTATAARQSFVDVALPATLIFVAGGLVAVGLTRLEALGRAVGVDWRGNRTWLALLVGVVGLVVVIGTPVAFLLGASVEAMMGAILGPLGAITAGLATVLAPVGEGIGRIAGPLAGPGATPPSGTSPGGGPPLPSIPAWVGTILAAAVGVGLVAFALALRRLAAGGRRAARWRQPRTEERRIALSPLAVRLPGVHLPRVRLGHRPRPRTASEAYLALLRELQADERLARLPVESPAAHARRLRAAGAGSLSFDLLAADFELERYAGARLSHAEVGRAIRRARPGRRPRLRAASRAGG